MDNENTKQATETANPEAEQRAAYMRSLVQPLANGNKGGRRVWSIDLETFWLPYFTAHNVAGNSNVAPEALGAPLRLAKDADGKVRFSKAGKPVIRVVKDIADGVKLVRENFVAQGLAFVADVRTANPEGFKAEVEAAQQAGGPIISRQSKDLAAAIVKRQEAEREEAEEAATKAAARAAKQAAKSGGKVPVQAAA